MKKIRRAAALTAGLFAGLAWFRSQRQKRRTADGALLLDDSAATPAPFALSQLSERPLFEEDEGGRSFATVEDVDARDDGYPGASKPLTIDELRAD